MKVQDDHFDDSGIFKGLFEAKKGFQGVEQ